MKYIAVIPARYASSRFPGKPLAMISGKSMIRRVYDGVNEIQGISETYVATDDERIADEVKSFGGNVIMTGECASGTDRLYSACKNLDFDIVLNIQGDEPLVNTEIVQSLMSAFDDTSVKMATLCHVIENESEISNPNIAKLIVDSNSDAIYFSRCTIPYNRDNIMDVVYRKHIGMYAYTKEMLAEFANWEQTPLEKAECLEQLRVIEHGGKIRVVETQHNSIGVDLPEHITVIEEELKRRGLS
jgi:3-deoxy-manno-octulosonate cytidylyltransferase (CMP-KDO synthetase)